jgi:hypothetical protein
MQKITDGRLTNKITNKEVRIRVALNQEVTGFLQKLNLLTQFGQVRMNITGMVKGK